LFILKKKLFFRLRFVLINNAKMRFVNKTLNSIDMVDAPSNFLDQQKN